MNRRLAVFAVAVVFCCAALKGTALAADADLSSESSADAPWGVVRVIAELAEVKTGPGFSYRTVYVAPRGETLIAVERANREYWFRVKLPDGTFGWVLGDQVLALNVDPSATAPPGFFSRVASAIFSPPALLVGDVGMSFSAGVIGGEGMVMFRPAMLLAPHLALEGFVGETVGEQLDVLYYGLSANLFVWPTSPVTPFFSMGGGGTWGRTSLDNFAVTAQAEKVRARAGNLSLASVGGGLLISLKKRITLRFDYRDHLVFDPNKTQDLKEFSGGLAIFF